MEHAPTAAHHEGHSPEEVRKHIKTYVGIFFALAFFTVITVAVSYLHLATGPAVTLALIIATIKASLVVFFFMHLKSEKAWIVSILLLTLGLFLLMIAITMLATGTVLTV